MGVERDDMNDLIEKAKESLKGWAFDIDGNELDYHFISEMAGGMEIDVHVNMGSVEFYPYSKEPDGREDLASVEFGDPKIVSALIKNGDIVVGALSDFSAPAMRVILGAVVSFATEAEMSEHGCDKGGVPFSEIGFNYDD